MKLGKWELISVKSGKFGLDGGAMFGVVPKVLWNKTNPADEQNRIDLATRSLLLISNDRKILVDTGLGNKFDDKFKSIYAIQNIPIDEALKQKNILPDEITDVIITHLHFDHTGGSTKRVNGKVVPTFPNAKYYVQKDHYHWALNPSEKDKASFLLDDFQPLEEHGQLIILEGSTKITEEIEVITTNGHTPAQQHLKLTVNDKTIFYCGDLIPTSSHIQFPYIMSYDLYPLTTLKEKKEILPIAYEEKWILFFEHDPLVSSVTITSGSKGFVADTKNIIPD